MLESIEKDLRRAASWWRGLLRAVAKRNGGSRSCSVRLAYSASISGRSVIDSEAPIPSVDRDLDRHAG
jgi:hypothetical protein